MQHVKQIREIALRGETNAAHDALDNLLALGPKNTEALKLRASLYEREGRFGEELQIWNKIMLVDQEDPDLLSYVLKRQTEEREHFYFTDDLQEGGRRFRAYPRSLVRMAVMGFTGCIGFLLASRIMPSLPVLNQMDQASQAMAMLGLFLVMVMGPWIGIMYIFINMLMSLTVNRTGIEFKTSMRRISMPWPTIDQVILLHDLSGEEARLSLMFVPKDKVLPIVEIDLGQDSTCIRARSYLINEISRSFHEPHYMPSTRFNLDGRTVRAF